MLLIFPIAAFLLFFRILRRNMVDWRRAVLASAIFWATCIVGITETLSVGNHLTRSSVGLSWASICGVLLVLLYFHKIGTGRPQFLKSEIRPERGFSLSELDLSTKGLVAGSGIIVLLVGATALLSAPNMWDAMEYHLPRVVMWMSNHSVQFYPTPDYAQLVLGPWSAYAMLHSYLLWGSDRFVNLVEFFSFCGCLVGVSLAAKMLGAGVRGQILAAIVCATIPEGVLEASGPLNTYVVSFWILTAIVFLMSANDDSGWLNTLCIGLSAGLAVLTKGTAYILFPFLIFAIWWMGSWTARIIFLKRSAVLVALILLVNSAQYLRCYDLTASPLGMPVPEAGSRFDPAMSHMTFRNTLANALRNISLHCGTRSEQLNLRIEKLFRLAIQKIGVRPDDPQQIWLGERFQMNTFSSDEYVAGNPLHLILLSLSIVFVIWRRSEGVRCGASWYGLGIVMAFLLLSGLLMWTRWSSRYQMPLFVLGSALIGLVLERYFPRRMATAMVIALIPMAALFALANKTRSLVPWSRVDDIYHSRSIQYFAHMHQKDAPTFIAAAEAVKQSNCADIAIDSYAPVLQTGHTPRSFFVYPLFPLIYTDARPQTVWYTGVHNSTRRYADGESHRTPCAVVCIDCADKPEKWDEYRAIGGKVSVFDYIAVFSHQGAIVNSSSVFHIMN
jgi:4-amino-4-deoxy-L-arabinose transferase-like glycosyltransferase